jgi:hypothetical protein
MLTAYRAEQGDPRVVLTIANQGSQVEDASPKEGLEHG